MSLRAKYFLQAWGPLAESYPQCFSQEVYRLLVPEVVDAIARLDIAIAVKGANSDSRKASPLKRSACSSMTVWRGRSTNRLP